MKPLAIIFLAFLLILGPVAWIVEACLDGHPHHVSVEQVAAQDDRHDDDATPSIHCAVLDQQFGAALRSAPAGITRSLSASLIDTASSHEGISASTAADLWRDALFKGFFSSLSSSSISRYLVLSVLRI